jgi:uncharacterized protein with HEPN domain
MDAKQRQLRLQDYLEHMLEASRLVQQCLAGIDKAEFFGSRMIQQAVLMNIVIIGETATKIRDEHTDFVKTKINAAVLWHKMIGMRNRMTHGYFDTDFEIVWDAVKTHLPMLEHFFATQVEQQNGPESIAATPLPDFGLSRKRRCLH